MKLKGWQDFCEVVLQIASTISGGENPSPNAGFWQPDAHRTTWQAPGAVPGSPGYGEWAGPSTPDPFQNWESLPWFDVKCDAMGLSSTTGFTPYEWNASPGTLSATLYDPEIIYSPIGPPGALDDIGIDTPIRILVRWTPDSVPVEVALWSGLIRTITHSFEPDGPHISTIAASEATEIYGRTNPPELTTLTGVQTTKARLATIHDRSDRPGALPYPTMADGDGLSLVTDNLAQNVWQELCLAVNSNGAVTVTRTEGNTPRAHGIYPAVDPATLQFAHTIGMECSPADEPPSLKNPNAGRWLPDDGTGSNWLPDGATPGSPGYAEWVTYDPLVVSPTALSLTLDIGGIANDISVAPEGGTAATAFDAGSAARWGHHSFTRHDLKMEQPGAQTVADRILERLAWAAYHCAALPFPMLGVRDLWAFVGEQNALQAGDWFHLNWDDPQVVADVLVCQVTHSIEPDSWTVEVTGELHNLVTGS